MSYTVRLEVFEGPLELLLRLIEENRVDIYDIPIALITDQYLAHLQGMSVVDLDVLSDFILLATELLHIKSRMLIPRPKSARAESLQGDEDEDPRQNLVKKLITYKKYRKAADYLGYMYEGELPRVYYREPEVREQDLEIKTSLAALIKAAKAVWNFIANEDTLELAQEDVDVAAKMEQLLERMLQSENRLVLQDCFRGTRSKREALAWFLALLELVRLGKVMFVQEHRFGPIEVFWAGRDG